MVHLIAIVLMAGLCGLWAWLQLGSGCEGGASCGDGGCGACKRDH